MKVMQYGILGQTAPELRIDSFIDGQGNKMDAPRLADMADSVKIIFCFQAWCPSCHTKGFPSLQQLTNIFDKDINDGKLNIIAIQTSFEGRDQNSENQLREMQKKYNVSLPFGHDDAHPRPKTMTDYRNGGTPWYIIIDRNNKVIYNDFHVDMKFAEMLITQAIAGENETPQSFKYVAKDNPAKNRYEIQLDENNMAIVTYKKEKDVLYINHTEVPSSLRGKGYGAVMMEAALEKIESQGKKIVPVCSYAKHYSHRFHRWAHLLA